MFLEDLMKEIEFVFLCLVAGLFVAIIAPLVMQIIFGGGFDWRDRAGMGLCGFAVFWISFHVPTRQTD